MGCFFNLPAPPFARYFRITCSETISAEAANRMIFRVISGFSEVIDVEDLGAEATAGV
jgi:hypothetical protein